MAKRNNCGKRRQEKRQRRAKRKAKKASKGRKKESLRVDLAPSVEFIHEHLTEALCQEVFQAERTTERERKWSLFALARFWVTVVLTAPPSLAQLLDQTRRRERTGLLPYVDAAAASFYQKCKNFSHSFFQSLFERFVSEIGPKARKVFCAGLRDLEKKFSAVQIIDGSRLDRIAKRLKILWNERAVILPGCITVVYDIFRGYCQKVCFFADAARAEIERAEEAIRSLEPGTLLVGDRLYCTIKTFNALEERGCFGLFRYNKTLGIKKLKVLSSEKAGHAQLQDHIVEAGSGSRKVLLRMITVGNNGKRYKALTNVLDPKRLTAQEIASLYPVRWQVERVFSDLKDVLNLNKLYASNPNAVAMQVYATALVHTAFRVAQGEIAQKVSLPPEELSPKKLYPRLALASIVVIEAELVFEKTCEANPGRKLKKLDWRCLPETQTTLQAIKVQHRTTKRRKRRYCKSRGQWKSFRHVPGGTLLS